MIDYDKLRIAHELILIVNEKYSLATYVGCTFNTYHRLYSLNCDWFEDYENLDDLIAKLQKLTQPEEPKAKYGVGQRLFMLGGMSLKNIESFTVDKILPEESFIAYYGENDWWGYESELYPTKLALLEAQIEYWQKLQDEEENDNHGCSHGNFKHYDCKLCYPKECQHEFKISKIFGTNPPCETCIKCSNTRQIKCQHEFKPYKLSEQFNQQCIKCGQVVSTFIPSECQHESDGEDYRYKCAHHYKCKKCGEFYR